MANEKEHELVTTAQVERTYKVKADTPDQARDRLRTHFKDPELLRDGIVTEIVDAQKDTTDQRIKAINGNPVGEAVGGSTPESVTPPARARRQKDDGGAANGETSKALEGANA